MVDCNGIFDNEKNDAFGVHEFLAMKSFRKIGHHLYSLGFNDPRLLAISKIEKRPKWTKIQLHL